MRDITPEFAAYCAGFFDGEGCVTFATMTYRRGGKSRSKAISLRVVIGNCFLPILQKFQLHFGGKVYKKSRAKNPNAADQWLWCLTYEHAMPFLRAIQPFVFVKAPQIGLALEFSEYRESPKEQRCERLPHGEGVWKRTPESIQLENSFKDRMHMLNRRGAPDVEVRTGDSPRVTLSGIES